MYVCVYIYVYIYIYTLGREDAALPGEPRELPAEHLPDLAGWDSTYIGATKVLTHFVSMLETISE